MNLIEGQAQMSDDLLHRAAGGDHRQEIEIQVARREPGDVPARHRLLRRHHLLTPLRDKRTSGMSVTGA